VSLRIRWRDIDNYGHVNNAVYLNYLEECRDRLVEDLFGLDSGAQIGLEYRFGLFRATQLAVHRTNNRTIQFLLQRQVVGQDGDFPLSIDAIGAIGIARCFAYGGMKGREIYNPDEPPVMHASFAQYKKAKGHSVNHFYEKLLLLKNRMNTRTGRRLAIGSFVFLISM